LSGNTWPYSQDVWEGQVTCKFAIQATEKKIAMIARQMQIVNKADFQVHGKASPWGCLACRFTRKTAGFIDSRLN